jgi:hypothetical protein
MSRNIVNAMTVDELYTISLTGSGTPLVKMDDLENIVYIGKKNSKMIGALEVYHLKDGLELPCVEHGIYGGEIDPEIENLSPDARISFLEKEMNNVFDRIGSGIEDYRFSVWMVDAVG